jgi:hypothetical protein
MGAKTFELFKIGDTSLPAERPEMLDDDLLKQLHHVLLEVSQRACAPFSLTSSFSDPHRRGFHDMSKVRARLFYLEWDTKHGPHLAFSHPISAGSHL